MSQGGEFGLVLVTLAAAEGLLIESALQVVLATIILSIALTPLLVASAEPLAQAICFPGAKRN